MTVSRILAIFAIGFLMPWTYVYAADPNPLMTPWAVEVDENQVLPEYPRPQMVRKSWLNLNGLWDYAIAPVAQERVNEFEGKILVPFAVESALSRVQRSVGSQHNLWYERKFQIPAAWSGQRIKLHFGAVDWSTQVWVNGKPVGRHQGGFTPFSFDITDALVAKSEQTITLRVWDPTDEGLQPVGKQTNNPGGIWYTSVTGIWQTVWLEPVPVSSIDRLHVVPDIDRETLQVQIQGQQLEGMNIKVTAYDQGREIAVSEGIYQKAASTLTIPSPKLWSPRHPFLYDLRVTVSRKGQIMDEVTSYFAMRKISLGVDAQGRTRIMLNHEALFQYGLLDQGWWPDGLYTAPTEDAMVHDIKFAQQAGFNMLRKHVKVEPARWYYNCDRMGMIVWQDMPSSRNQDKSSGAQFEYELREMVEALHPFPSIVMWVLFNEGWGQYDTPRLTNELKILDPTRLVNSASGWDDFKVGDINDIHRYPGPARPELETQRAAVLGEFGGLGLPIKGHLWKDQDSWGYETYLTKDALQTAYADLIQDLRVLIQEGLSAAIYTQITDVEVEVNGWMTYDRRELKADTNLLFDLHRDLYFEPTRVARRQAL
ncbi:MAG TPA: glycoside hydrolase family 2 TIM barrel-domain containing protein [Oligoflexus sp.]|uniref:glycoside hydrolase family 2 protein n=1 Tax=Oligoflexus sp. TaxID=1971216 RepID=UPI002D576CB9|nr:sugar-binding domain-containing protein [Oligoflexus sp.]HYX32660.1 glycoside hydrolase family 2 TIM barrel-domain containing protein [Oligoflexus sp.]